MSFGLLSAGAYVPRRRLNRQAIAAAHAWAIPGLAAQAKGERAYAAWDEDAITMAVEAARDCLIDVPGVPPAAVILASTTLPYVDRLNAVVVAGALDLEPAAMCQDHTGSLRAGVGALASVCNSGGSAPTLIVASDLRRARTASAQEMAFGAGAAAFLVGHGDAIAEFVGSATISADFVDHYRTHATGYDYSGEERWIREEGYAVLIPAAVEALVAKTGIALGTVRWLAPPVASPAIGALIAKRLGMPVDRLIDGLAAKVGDLGVAQPLAMLASALEQSAPGDLILVLGFGQGCDAMLFRATERVGQSSRRKGVAGALADRFPDDAYLRFQSFSDNICYDWGPRAEADAKTPPTEQYRSNFQIASFKAGQCRACGQVQFPQLPLCVNCEVAADFVQVRLTDAPAKVATYTADWLQFHPSPPLYFGLVQFDNGARVLMEMVDVEGRDLDVGTAVRMVFRIKERDRPRDFARYFWKAVPLNSMGAN